MNFVCLLPLNKYCFDVDVTWLAIFEISERKNFLYWWLKKKIYIFLGEFLIKKKTDKGNLMSQLDYRKPKIIHECVLCLVVVSFFDGENHWPVVSHWQTLSHNVVHLALIKIWTHNISSDGHWLHRKLYIQSRPQLPLNSWETSMTMMNVWKYTCISSCWFSS